MDNWIVPIDNTPYQSDPLPPLAPTKPKKCRIKSGIYGGSIGVITSRYTCTSEGIAKGLEMLSVDLGPGLFSGERIAKAYLSSEVIEEE